MEGDENVSSTRQGQTLIFYNIKSYDRKKTHFVLYLWYERKIFAHRHSGF